MQKKKPDKDFFLKTAEFVGKNLLFGLFVVNSSTASFTVVQLYQ